MPEKKTDDFIVIAHRGASEYEPENTFSALRPPAVKHHSVAATRFGDRCFGGTTSYLLGSAARLAGGCLSTEGAAPDSATLRTGAGGTAMVCSR